MQKRKPFLMTSLALACLCPVAAQASESKGAAKVTGNLSGQLKAMHVVGGEDNGYDPNDGTAYLAKLKYEAPLGSRLKLGLGGYAAGDIFNSTNFDSERVARGMFVNGDGSTKGQMGEVYLKYQAEAFAIDAGRMLYASPLTSGASSTMPNFFTAFGVSTDALDGFSLGLAQLTEMSFGARAMTEFGLIGEATGSGGASVRPDMPGMGQARFHDIGDTMVGPAADTNGVTVFNASYHGIEDGGIQVWDYYADDIVNNLYVEGHKVFPVAKGKKVKVQAQGLYQSDVGDALAGERDFGLLGLKATLVGKGWAVFGAVNHSTGDNAMLNSWGGDPAYTSTIFSSNAYRENVTAFKVGFKYKFTDKLSFMGAYANYGQSDTMAPVKAIRAGSSGMATPRTDADELDLVVTYKIQKGLAVKLMHAMRTSEYDGTNGRDLTQNHTRLIVNYKFK